MKKLDPSKTYAVGNMYAYHDPNPEYGDNGWFVTFEYPTSYKNDPMPFNALPQQFRMFFLKICEETILPSFNDYIDSELDNLD
jgi:hypothetical protein